MIEQSSASIRKKFIRTCEILSIEFGSCRSSERQRWTQKIFRKGKQNNSWQNFLQWFQNFPQFITLTCNNIFRKYWSFELRWCLSRNQWQWNTFRLSMLVISSVMQPFILAFTLRYCFYILYCRSKLKERKSFWDWGTVIFVHWTKSLW